MQTTNMKHIKTFEGFLDEAKKGLWANIHAKRKRGEKPAKPGDKDYPDEKAWQAAQESASEDILEWRKPKVEDLVHDMKVKITRGRYAGATGKIQDFQLTDGGDLVDDQIDILVDKPGKPMNYIGLDDILIESVNEASQPRFEVGKKYKHSKFGEFEVLELMPGQTTRVQFKKEPKGETSIIAGWGSDGYPVIK